MSGDKEKFPSFVDNQDGNTMARAIRDSLKLLRKQKKSPTELQIASAYFNPQGLQLIAKEAKHLPSIRLLLGAEPEPEIKRQRRLPGDQPDPDWTEQQVEKTILTLDQALREERNRLPFDIETDQAIKTLLEFLSSEKIEARRYTSRFLHAKVFLFLGPEEQLLTGSSNLTRAGLQSNLELNLGIRDPDLLGEIKNWYQQLWEEAESYDLAAIYQELFAEYTPHEIYLMVLWQLYGEEITQEAEKDDSVIRLTNFQNHGVKRAMRILEKYHGVLIADGVGLGKTFIAAAIIKEFKDQRKRVLTICPAALRSTWSTVRYENDSFFSIVSFNQLREDQLFGGGGQYLEARTIEEYDLIVIDEAHNYRTPDTLNAKVLRTLLRQRKKLLLLTATPVNNGIMDLYVLYSYFLKQDAALSDEGIISLSRIFKESAKTEPNELNPDTLFPIIDATTVKRPRSFIKEYYPDDTIPLPNGEEVPLTFPKPIPIRVTYRLDELNPVFFDKLKEAIMPKEGEPKLTLARYKAENYLKGSKRTLRFQYIRDDQKKNTSIELDIVDAPSFIFAQFDDNPLGIVVEPVDLAASGYQGVRVVESNLNDRESWLESGDIIRFINGKKIREVGEFRRVISNALSRRFENAAIGLLRSNLLKRFESSINSFSLTLGRLIRSYKFFIESLDNERVPLREFFQEFINIDDDEVFERMLEDEKKFDDASKYDVDKLRADLENDLAVLSYFKSETEQIDIHSSSKLAELSKLLKTVIEKAERDAIDEEDARQKRKVMVFSYFEETVDWIVKYLGEVLENDPELAPYKHRLAVASGGRDYWEGLSRDKVISSFAPISTQAREGTEDKFDLVICTDVLAEGLNLQQCRNIINYDLPWNPMRLIQRHGRIDRLLSDHEKVYLYSFFPDERLDDLLMLEYRIRNKLLQAAATIGVEDTPIVGGVESEITYSDAIQDIMAIHDEDVSFYEEGGTASAAQTGEIYRAELRRAIYDEGIDLTELPRRVGSGLRKGKKSGYFFCAEVTFRDNDTEESKTRPLLRFVPDNIDDEIIEELATCLRMIECTKDSESISTTEIMLGAYDAWQKAKENIIDWWSPLTDPAKIQPEVPKVNREVSEFLKEQSPTGLDDEGINQMLSSIEAPWPARDSNLLREIWKMEFSTNQEKSDALYQRIEEIGAEPYVSPRPLIPIEQEDIKLICWMAVEAEDE